MMRGQPAMAAWSISAMMYLRPAAWSLAEPRRSRPGPMQAQMDPMAMPALAAAAFRNFGSVCEGSSIGISTVWKPQFLSFLNRCTLSLVNGEA